MAGHISPQELLARKQSEKGMDPDREELPVAAWGARSHDEGEFLARIAPRISRFSCAALTILVHGMPGLLELHIADSEQNKEIGQPYGSTKVAATASVVSYGFVTSRRLRSFLTESKVS
eukprot:s1044_g19.t1